MVPRDFRTKKICPQHYKSSMILKRDPCGEFAVKNTNIPVIVKQIPQFCTINVTLYNKKYFK